MTRPFSSVLSGFAVAVRLLLVGEWPTHGPKGQRRRVVISTLGPMRALVSRLGGAVVMVLALSPAVIVAAPAAHAYTPSAATTAAYEARVLYLINVQRTKYGRAKLAASPCPDRYSESWAAYLSRTGAFYHREMMPFLTGCGVSRVAENLGRGNVSADRMVVAWMASPGHRANILDGRLTRIGVGAVYASGRWTIATNFTRP